MYMYSFYIYVYSQTSKQIKKMKAGGRGGGSRLAKGEQRPALQNYLMTKIYLKHLDQNLS